MEAKRVGTSLAERLEAPELLSQAKAATAEADQPTVTPETRQILLERVSDFRKRLVIEEPLRRWWQPKNH
jgi:CTP:molybdopterin cytidylyltransferase MocA